MTAPLWLPIAIQVIALVSALLTFAWQVHRARFNQSVDLLFRLEGDFFGRSKIAQRSLAATNYLANQDDLLEMEDLLDFFETVSMLTRKGALDLYMVWHTFNYWIERYYAVAQPYILQKQAAEPGIWEDLSWLMPRLKKLQARKGAPKLDQDELSRFLIEEATEG